MAVEIKMYGNWNHRENQSSLEVSIIEKNSKQFLINYETPLLNNGTIHNNIDTLVYTESEEWVLSGTYEKIVNANPHVQRTIEINWKVAWES